MKLLIRLCHGEKKKKNIKKAPTQASKDTQTQRRRVLVRDSYPSALTELRFSVIKRRTNRPFFLLNTFLMTFFLHWLVAAAGAFLVVKRPSLPWQRNSECAWFLSGTTLTLFWRHIISSHNSLIIRQTPQKVLFACRTVVVSASHVPAVETRRLP